MGDLDAVELVRASGPCHEYRCRRCPDVLHIFERAFVFANYEVQVACERQKTCGHSISIDGRGLSAPSLSRSMRAGVLYQTSMPSNGFALPVLCTKTGVVDVPMFSIYLSVLGVDELAIPFAHDEVKIACERHKTCDIAVYRSTDAV